MRICRGSPREHGRESGTGKPGRECCWRIPSFFGLGCRGASSGPRRASYDLWSVGGARRSAAAWQGADHQGGGQGLVGGSGLCRKAKELGYPHELWTMRLLARDAREHGPALGHDCLASPAQGTVCKILNKQELKPHRVRYYLERRDPVVHTWFHRLEDVGCYEPNFGNGGLVALRPFAEQIL